MQTKYRFTIRFLLVLTALVCVACAAIRYPTRLCVTVTFSAAVAALVMSIVGAATTRGALRAFFLGFAIVGWAHLILAFAPHICSRIFLSRYLLDQLAVPLGYAMSPQAYIEEESLEQTMLLFSAGSPPDRYYKFIVIGQSLITLFVASAGGALGRYFYRRSNGPAAERAS